MRTNRFNTIILAIVASVVALSSCSMTETATIESAPKAAAQMNINGVISGTKAADVASIKNEWNENDWIYVSSNGAHSYFKADNNGAYASFSVCSSANLTDGNAYAIYPKSVKLDNGAANFSLAGQNGSLATIDQKFALMTASANIANGNATFAFESQISVLAISVKDVLYASTNISKIVVSGSAISSEIAINANGSSISAAAAQASEIVISNPVIENGFVFIAVPASANGSSINVAAYDNANNGEFFATVSSAAAGEITDITAAQWNGGYQITFNPSTEDWNNINA